MTPLQAIQAGSFIRLKPGKKGGASKISLDLPRSISFIQADHLVGFPELISGVFLEADAARRSHVSEPSGELFSGQFLNPLHRGAETAHRSHLEIRLKGPSGWNHMPRQLCDETPKRGQAHILALAR